MLAANTWLNILLDYSTRLPVCVVRYGTVQCTGTPVPVPVGTGDKNGVPGGYKNFGRGGGGVEGIVKSSGQIR